MLDPQKELITKIIDNDGKQYEYRLLNGSKGWVVELTTLNEFNRTVPKVVANGCSETMALEYLLLQVSELFKRGISSLYTSVPLIFPCLEAEKSICKRMIQKANESGSVINHYVSNSDYAMQAYPHKPRVLISLRNHGLGLSITSDNGTPQVVPSKIMVTLSQFAKNLDFEDLIFEGYLLSDQKLEISDLLFHDQSLLGQTLNERVKGLEAFASMLPTNITISPTFFTTASKEKACKKIIALGYHLRFLPAQGRFTKAWNENNVVLANGNVTKLQIMSTLAKSGMINLGAIVNDDVVVIAQVSQDEIKHLDILDVVEVSYGSINSNGMLNNAHLVKKADIQSIHNLEPKLARELGYEVILSAVVAKPQSIGDGFFWQ